jgi:perosamine synthetase
MITSDDDQLMERVEFLKNHGMRSSRRYWHEEVGYNYRMTALQAAFGLGQLEGIDTILARKDKMGAYYEKELSRVEGITVQKNTPHSRRIYWMMNILLEDAYGMDRDTLALRLKEQGVDTRIVFYPMTHLPIYRSNESFPVAAHISKRGLTIPSGTGITEEQMRRVIEAVASNAAR